MIRRRLDHVLIGRSHLSALCALELLERGGSVLLLDDGKTALGEYYARHANVLESTFLKRWGEDRDLPPLGDLDRHSSPAPVTFHVMGERVSLGNGPSRNLRELLRKFPELFGGPPRARALHRRLDGSFDGEFRAFMDRLAHGLSPAPGGGRPRRPPAGGAPWILRSVLESLRAAFPAVVRTDRGQALYLALRAFYQNVLDHRCGGPAFLDLVLNMLSPNVEIDTEAVTGGLVRILEERGGVHRAVGVEEWSFHGDRIWGVGLASFEGAARPGRLTVVGGLPRGLPLAWGGRAPVHATVAMEVPLGAKGGAPSPWDGLHVLADPKAMGTALPLLFLSCGGGRASLRVPVPARRGSRPEFHRAAAAARVAALLGPRAPWGPEEPARAPIAFSPDVWLSGPGRGRGRRTSPVFRRPSPGRRARPLRNARYHGPLAEASLGPLTSMTAMRGGDL